MIITPFETELYQKLSVFFAQHGFELLSDRKQFRKQTPTGFHNVVFSTSSQGQETWLDVSIGLRHQEIEFLAQQFLDISEEYRDDANTLVISIGKFNDDKYFRYKLHGTDDLDDVCDQIKEFLVQTGFAFMQKYDGLKALDQLFNKEPSKPCKYLYNQTHRCFKGIIAARFTNNERFLRLIDLYRLQVAKLGASIDEQQTFERLLSFLLYHSLN
ncbi:MULTISPECIES: hypothetical protein [unclassified Siphonobacter]|uniref:hypothetical protein n=1 Tax=unclassified Siphonobacter TaxID=2635712 RepID=UPI00277FFFC0|nr:MULTISPECIES: hypothetical protein [unclassified Siphonobacter]MDQ1089167.1 hypothetical protein [Siphonobacter sp. SORGH_AS_1065]MDR6195349.1 hypothetical protein [Siphonobacter sp. SORGH_AS_0500]